MTASGVYGFFNVKSEKWYVGQSISIPGRRNVHVSLLRRGAHPNPHLQAAFDLYGEDSFEFYVLEPCLSDCINEKEIYWIASLASADPRYGYNIEPGGGAGKHLPESVKLKISLANKGRKQPAEAAAKSASSRRGLKLSLEHRKKLSIAARSRDPAVISMIAEKNRGKKRTPEARKRMSESAKRRGIPQGQRDKITESLKGRVFSAQHRARLSEAATKRYSKVAQ